MADGDVGERLFSEDFDVENDLPKFLDSVLDKVDRAVASGGGGVGGGGSPPQ